MEEVSSDHVTALTSSLPRGLQPYPGAPEVPSSGVLLSWLKELKRAQSMVHTRWVVG